MYRTTSTREFTAGVLAGITITDTLTHATLEAAQRYASLDGREIKAALTSTRYINRNTTIERAES